LSPRSESIDGTLNRVERSARLDAFGAQLSQDIDGFAGRVAGDQGNRMSDCHAQCT